MRYSNRSDASALCGLAGLGAVVIAVIVFFFVFLLPFLADLQARLAPLMAMATR